jgi:uncharacterized protein YdcH (DUF465 family)
MDAAHEAPTYQEGADVMTDTEETRRLLLSSSEAFRELSASHHALDDRLKHLSSKPHLSGDEQFEEVTLKKEKLRLKDQMEALVRRHHAGMQPGLPA